MKRSKRYPMKVAMDGQRLAPAELRETCGTNAGRSAHWYYQEWPCRPCMTAHAADSRERYEPRRERPWRDPTWDRHRCGSAAGYQRHVRRREVACEPCQEAERLYSQWIRGGQHGPTPFSEVVFRSTRLARAS